MVGYLAEIRPQTLNDVSIVSRSLNSATAVPSETEVEAQVRNHICITDRLGSKVFSCLIESASLLAI